MLKLTNLVGFGTNLIGATGGGGGGGGGGGLSLSYVTSPAVDTSADTTYTFSSQSIGAADANRCVVVVTSALYIYGTPSVTCDSATVAGNAMTRVIHKGTTEGVACGIFAYELATGTTADITVTYSTTMSRCQIGVFRMLSVADVAGYATNTKAWASTGPYSMNVNVPTDGACIAIVQSRNMNLAWVSPMEAYAKDLYTNENGSVAMGTVAGTPTTVQATGTATGGGAGAFGCAASWSP